MAAVKPKTGPAKVRWANQVVKTADGRLIVRGVDVPASGWDRVSSGKTSVTTQHVGSRPSFAVPRPIATKREALATARRAGLDSPPRTPSTRKSAGCEQGAVKTSIAPLNHAKGKQATTATKKKVKPVRSFAASGQEEE